MGAMQAMVLPGFGAALNEEQVDMPRPGAGEALVRVRACGVCFTDSKIIAGKMPNTMPPPLIPGHEVAGEVAAAGHGVKGLREGERVCINFYLTCGNCRYCRGGSETLCTDLQGQLGRSVNGGYAQYIAVPAENLLPLPAEVPFEHGAVLADAVATSLHAVRERAGVRPGQRVGVIGVGGVGVHVLQMARLCGAEVVAMDTKPESVELAARHGAQHQVRIPAGDPGRATPDPSVLDAVATATGGQGLDAVVDTVGSQATISMALAMLARKGRLVFLGYDPTGPFLSESLQYVLRELTVMGSRAATKQELAEAIELVRRGAIVPVVTETHPLAAANQVLDRLRAGEITGRAVLLPD